MSNRNRTLVGFLLTSFLTSFILEIYHFAQEISSKTGLRSSSRLVDAASLWASAGCAAFGDTALAFTLVFFLYRGRCQVSFTRTASMINRIIMYSLSTGLLIAAFVLAAIVTALAMPNTSVYILLLELIPKCESLLPAMERR